MPADDPILLPHQIAFDPADPQGSLRELPAGPAVFALRGASGEPYLNTTANLRSRLHRLLQPAAVQSRRLQLAAMVRTIAWVETAGDFTARWHLYRAARQAFGDRAAKRLHLHSPFFLRMGMRNRYPRLWATQSLSTTALSDLFGPFASRAAAERYAEQVLDLFLLRRCFQDLDPDPAFPGCIYSEMKKCLAPCYAGCTDERYDEEADAVHAFLRTRGDSRLHQLAQEREQASEALDFEAAADLHNRYSKVEAVAALAPDVAGALAGQNSVLVQTAAVPDTVDLYLLRKGTLTGPEPLSVLGMRLPNEASGSSSLFAHPAAFAPVPLGAGSSASSLPSPDERLQATLARLEAAWSPGTKQDLCEHQSLFARWYFRPQHKRVGELIAADAATGDLPRKALLRAAARVFVAGLPKAAAAAVADSQQGKPLSASLPEQRKAPRHRPGAFSLGLSITAASRASSSGLLPAPHGTPRSR